MVVDTVDRRVAELCSRQWGLVTLAQARSLGMTIHQVEHRCTKGLLEPVRRAVYRVTAVPPSAEQSVLAAVLSAGRGAFASHETACWLFGLPLAMPDRVEVTTPPDRRLRATDVVWHRSAAISRAEIVVVRAIPTCSIERAIGDVSARYDIDALAGFVAAAVDRGLTTHARVARVVTILAPTRVRDRDRLRRALEVAG